MNQSVIKKIALVCYLTVGMLNIALLSGSKAISAQAKEMVPTCKWSQEDCPNSPDREVCLVDGSGYTCECGSVTRPCT